MGIPFIVVVFLAFVSIPKIISQSPTCNGISISYVHNSGVQIPPADPTNQPYSFQSTLTITNAGADELKSWRVFVGFQHGELLVSSSNAVLDDGSSLPANVSDGVVFAGFPLTDLKTAVQTAGDLNQMQARVQLVGTQFGVAPPNVSLPANIYLVNDGFLCTAPSSPANNETHVCCVKDPNARPNTTVPVDKPFDVRREGDLTIMYDVISTQETEYIAQVTVSNHNPLSRVDHWQLSWDWMRDEFIYSMKGAYPSLIDTNACIFGRQGEFYKELDFSKALNCQRRPTVIDLPLDKTNDTQLGSVPFCCRNGTLLPPSMDPSKSLSAFIMQVFKMPPDLNRTQLTPPQNWRINSVVNPDYQCGQPVRVSPTLFPNPSGLTSDSTAVASWQVVCNITRSKPDPPKCCVSFSAFFNKSVVPCSTCACGCNNANMCSATSPALLLPSQALLVPFENRTRLAAKFAKDNDWALPDQLPCADNCGVSINWHLLSDFKDGWNARMTIFNWGETSFADWFAAVQLDKSIAGFEEVYSFNGTRLKGSNNTIFLQGLPGLNYLVAESKGRNPKKDPRVPGSQQSIISFTKKNTPGLNVARGDGFPTKFYFNGEECAVPPGLPITSHGSRTTIAFVSFLASLVPLLFL